MIKILRGFLHHQDGNGFISRSELKHVMMNLGEKMSEEECNSLVEVNIVKFTYKIRETEKPIIVSLGGGY